LKFLPEVGSMNKAETHAEGTKEYADHIREMVEARRLANRARAQYEADKAYIDMVRSQESSRRAEMSLR
jgi:gamma-glutamyltranspeptidase